MSLVAFFPPIPLPNFDFPTLLHDTSLHLLHFPNSTILKSVGDGTQQTAVSGLERDIQPPHPRPLAPSAGLSSEELTWSPDGRFVLSGTFPSIFLLNLLLLESDPPFLRPQERSTVKFTYGTSTPLLRKTFTHAGHPRVLVVLSIRLNLSRGT